MNSVRENAAWLVRSLILVGLMVLYGCSPLVELNQEELIETGKKEIDIVIQFERFLPNCIHEIGKSEILGQNVKWRSKAIFENRYIVTMSFAVSTSITGSSVEKKGDANFSIREVIEVVPENGMTTTSYGDQLDFGEDLWRKFVDSGGDFSSLDFEIRRNSPVPNIEMLLTW